MRTSTTAAVDLVVLAVRDGLLQLLLEQHQARSALPGRFLGAELDLADEAKQVLTEHAAATGTATRVDQLGAFGPHDRGQDGRVVSIGYVALVGPTSAAAGPARWTPVERVLTGRAGLVPGHQEVTAAAVERVRTLLEHTTAAAALCAPAFTVPELRAVYEAVWGRPLDSANFHRKVTGTAGFLEPTGEKAAGVGRPAILYRQGPATLLHPALTTRE